MTDLRLGREAHFDTVDGRPVYANLSQQDDSKETVPQLQVDRQTGRLTTSASANTAAVGVAPSVANATGNSSNVEMKKIADENDDETRLIGFPSFEEEDLEQMRRRYEEDDDDEFEKVCDLSSHLEKLLIVSVSLHAVVLLFWLTFFFQLQPTCYWIA